MNQDRLPMTVQGKLKLEAELKRLLQEDRPGVIRAIEEARAQGDLSENAEYDAAKERQALIEGRIQEIQAKIAGAEVIDPAMVKADRIVFGAHVVLEDLDVSEKVNYQIVGIDEADVKAGKISIMSPLARAMIGKVAGDMIVVQSPKGEKEYEVIEFFFR